jgi:FkbM family methyltransferase
MDNSSFVFRALEMYGTRFHHPGQWRVHARLREALHANIDRYMEVERRGLRWVLNPFDYVQQNLFWLGEHDRWDLFHVKRLLAPDAVICDIGANFGYYSLTLAEHLKPKGRIFAFEPHPATRGRLERHVAMNRLGDVVNVMPCALSDAPGILRMTSREDNTGAAHISNEGNIEVEVSTLDNFCDLHQLSRLDFVKIDVEGFEVRVLRGGEHTLKTFRPKLFVEMLPTQLERTGSSAAELANTLRGYGYSLYVSDRKRLLPLNTLPGESDLINVFCFPSEN